MLSENIITNIISKFTYYDEVKKIIRGRYDKTEEDRMSIGAFLNMLRDVGVKWTL